MADTAGPDAGHPSPGAVLAAVGYSVFIAADDLTVVTTMLRPIIDDLGIVLPDGLDDAAWIVNVYLIAFVAVMPLAGRVSDVVGRRRTFFAAYLVFLTGTIVIPLADTYVTLLVGRILTALGGGAMVPVALAVVGDVFPERRRARALGTLGAIETMGWVWGPLYGAGLVRYLDWRWQFWLNIPLALIGLALVWRLLPEHDRARADTVDWRGAAALTVALVSLNVALLGNAEIQSVTGLEELTGAGNRPDYRWLLLPAIAAGVYLWSHERRTTSPLVDRGLFSGRNVRVALVVNFLAGAGLIIAMVDVPIFVNAVESGIEHAAVIAGWVLSALTVSMAVASYVGGRFTERSWYRPPILTGLTAVVVAFALMGLTWTPGTTGWTMAAQLAVLGTGFGLVLAPTTAAVVDAAPATERGTAASVVMVVRLIGLSVGLSALTAWGLARFNALRSDLELPPLTDPGFADALEAASAEVTAQALAETFLVASGVAALGLLVATAMQRTGTDLSQEAAAGATGSTPTDDSQVRSD